MKAGDKVRISRPGMIYHGEDGVVVSYQRVRDRYTVDVRIKGSFGPITRRFNAEQLIFLPSDAPPIRQARE